MDFYDVKGDLETLLLGQAIECRPMVHPALHPGRSCQLVVQGSSIGFLGELHPRWCQQWDFAHAPVLFELDLDAVLRRRLPVVQPVGRYPAVERDIAVVVQEAVTHEALMRAIWSVDTDGLLREATLFDVYRPKVPAADIGAGEKSLAVRLSLQDDTATLTDERIEQVVDAIRAALAGTLSARARV